MMQDCPGNRPFPTRACPRALGLLWMASGIDGGNHKGTGGDEEDGESRGYLWRGDGNGMCYCAREIVKKG